ncbi:recombination regulator RecX [Vibrio rarus]|uniref:recombination regulator RecX n=1 Tax=Vibrio rarus TaxID=413403 RepID=UPI0021C3CDFB|nr:recombination regulator RecX [Vibrio rarus]
MYFRPTNIAAKKAALHFLSCHEHGQYELQQKLLNKGFDVSDIDEAIRFCREHHYLDDLRYSKEQVRHNVKKGHGERRIRQELQAKQVLDDIIEQALNEEPQDWFQLAKLSAENSFHHFATQGSAEYAQQVRFLQYQGFSVEQIRYALNSELLATSN